MTRASCVVLGLWLLAPAAVAHGQAEPPLPATDVLIGVHSILHVADMLTTSYALTHSDAVREANPLLKPFGRSPAAISAASGAFSAAEIWAITRMRATRPKTATMIALVVVATEMWAVTNNVRVMGRIQRARSGWRDPFKP